MLEINAKWLIIMSRETKEKQFLRHETILSSSSRMLLLLISRILFHIFPRDLEKWKVVEASRGSFVGFGEGICCKISCNYSWWAINFTTHEDGGKNVIKNLLFRLKRRFSAKIFNFFIRDESYLEIWSRVFVVMMGNQNILVILCFGCKLYFSFNKFFFVIQNKENFIKICVSQLNFPHHNIQ